jgi:hypothetical protein
MKRSERVMSTKKKKRKYTFRKGEAIPYESGGPMHEMIKAQRERGKSSEKALRQFLSPSKKKTKRK